MISLSLALLIALSLCACKKEKQKFSAYYFDWFDTATSIIGYEYTEAEFNATCDVIEGLMTEYHQLANIYIQYDNLNNLVTVNSIANGEHSVVKVDGKLIDLLLYARQMYDLTGGKMNIALGSVLSIWHDYRTLGLDDPKNAKLPPMDKLTDAAEHTDIDNLIIDEENSTVYLNDPKTRLDVGAIAKGYAVEMVARHLEEKGITGYLINAGGNIRTIGTRGDGTPWQIGIENPDTSATDKPHIEYLKLSGQSLVTSGSYQRYYTVNGINYHHIIDPDTLMPGERFLSVSVLCDHSGMGDAISTALFNMDLDEGKALVESLENVEAMWVLPDGTQVYSSGFENFTFDYE